MAVIETARKIHIPYDDFTQELWDKLSPSQKTDFDDLGKDNGYSGQNAMYFFLIYAGMVQFGAVNPDELQYRKAL